MNENQHWDARLTRCREHPPPASIEEGTMQRNTAAAAVKVIPPSRSSPTLAQRLAPFLLWSAAAVMCAARLYSTLGLLVPAFAFTPASPITARGVSDVELVASDF
jgi:hypothetical protein